MARNQLLIAAAAVLLFANLTHADLVSVSGVFTSTSPGCGTGDVVCSGVGTSRVTWGEPVPNTQLAVSLAFAPSTTLQDTDIFEGNVITLGRLILVNGTTQPGTEISSLSLRISTGGETPDLDIAISVETTLCSGTEPQAVCADYIYFTGANEFGSFRVWEQFGGNVDLRGRIGSLQLAGFGTINGVFTANQETGELGPEIDPAVLPPNLQVAFRSPSVTSLVPAPAGAAVLLLFATVATAMAGRRRIR